MKANYLKELANEYTIESLHDVGVYEFHGSDNA